MELYRKKDYCRPETKVTPLLLKELLCGSHEEGALEDVEYEDWKL